MGGGMCGVAILAAARQLRRSRRPLGFKTPQGEKMGELWSQMSENGHKFGACRIPALSSARSIA